MPKRKRLTPDEGGGLLTVDSDVEAIDGEPEELLPEGKLVCALTGDQRVATPQEETLQSFIEQLHREYGVALEDMGRDVRVRCTFVDEKTGKERTRSRTVSLAVYETGKPHDLEHIIRAGFIASPSAKADAKAIGILEEILGSLSDSHAKVFGFWTNGIELAFRMRTYHSRTGDPEFTELTDIPGPAETLEDLENAARRPLRVAAGDSLLCTFKRCHDYLYGNQQMRPDKAFWQLLYLIFCKILDEQQSSRLFFVGATEANNDRGRRAITGRSRTSSNKFRRKSTRMSSMGQSESGLTTEHLRTLRANSADIAC